jgi:penicillin-binding protein 1C
LDKTAQFRVNSSCYPLENMVYKNWFSIPTGIEYYYATSNTNYKALPPYLDGCSTLENSLMEFIYPRKNEVVLLPKTLGNSSSQVVFKLAHKRPETEIHWYLDSNYIATTANIHELLHAVKPGEYVLTAVDDDGNSIQQNLQLKMASEN